MSGALERAQAQNELQERREQMQKRIIELRREERGSERSGSLSFTLGITSVSAGVILEGIGGTRTAIAAGAFGLSLFFAAHLSNQDRYAAGQKAATYEAAQYVVEQSQGRPAIEAGAQPPEAPQPQPE
jgi:hypothetical protein